MFFWLCNFRYVCNLYKTGKLFNHKWHFKPVNKIALCKKDRRISMSDNDVAKPCAKYVTFFSNKNMS